MKHGGRSVVKTLGVALCLLHPFRKLHPLGALALDMNTRQAGQIRNSAIADRLAGNDIIPGGLQDAGKLKLGCASFTL